MPCHMSIICFWSCEKFRIYNLVRSERNFRLMGIASMQIKPLGKQIFVVEKKVLNIKKIDVGK